MLASSLEEHNAFFLRVHMESIAFVFTAKPKHGCVKFFQSVIIHYSEIKGTGN
jgi:hypothetical protein